MAVSFGKWDSRAQPGWSLQGHLWVVAVAIPSCVPRVFGCGFVEAWQWTSLVVCHKFVNKIAAVCAAVTVPTSPVFHSFFPGSTITTRSVPCAVPHGQIKWSLPSMSRFSSLFSAASVLLSSLGGPCGEFHSNAALVELPRVLRFTLANGPFPVSLPSR